MATAKTVKEPMPAFTGRYASIRKKIWKNTVGRPLPAPDRMYKPGSNQVFKTEQGYRTALRKEFTEEMRKIDKAENIELPKEIEIEIRWAKGSMGAQQATAEMSWRDSEGYHNLVSAKTRGWGYDKESSAVSDVLNEAPFGIKIALEIARMTKNRPYGISVHDGFLPMWSGGVGMSSFLTVFQKVGYTYKVYGSGDVYVLTRKR